MSPRRVGSQKLEDSRMLNQDVGHGVRLANRDSVFCTIVKNLESFLVNPKTSPSPNPSHPGEGKTRAILLPPRGGESGRRHRPTEGGEPSPVLPLSEGEIKRGLFGSL